jgi:hypothetical protein
LVKFLKRFLIIIIIKSSIFLFKLNESNLRHSLRKNLHRFNFFLLNDAIKPKIDQSNLTLNFMLIINFSYSDIYKIVSQHNNEASSDANNGSKKIDGRTLELNNNTDANANAKKNQCCSI